VQGRAERSRVGRATQGQNDGLIRLDGDVVEDGDADVEAALAGREGERTAGGCVVAASGSRAVAGGVVDGDRETRCGAEGGG
jgi:hypothetical protein